MSESRKFIYAIVASIVLHFLLLALIALFALIVPRETAASIPKPEPARPLQVTVIRKPAPTPPPVPVQPVTTVKAAPTPTPVTERKQVVLSSDGLVTTTEKPKNAKLESDVNSKFQSEKEGQRTSDRPSQSGRELNFTKFENQKAVVAPQQPATPPPAIAASTPVPTPPPLEPTKTGVTHVVPNTPTSFFQPTPVPRKQKEKPKTTRPADNAVQFAKNTTLTPAPTPPQTPTPSPTTEAQNSPPSTPAPDQPKPQPSQAPVQPSFRHESVKTKTEGSNGIRGSASVEAASTPRGRYLKSVYDAVGSRWYYYVERRTDLMMTGEVLIEFYVTENGKIEQPRILSNTANDTFASYSLRAVLESQPPPLPEELAAVAPGRRMRIELTFNLFPN